MTTEKLDNYHPDVLTPEQNEHARTPEVLAKYKANAEKSMVFQIESYRNNLITQGLPSTQIRE